LASLTQLTVLTRLTDYTQLIVLISFTMVSVWTVGTRDRVAWGNLVNSFGTIDTVESGCG